MAYFTSTFGFDVKHFKQGKCQLSGQNNLVF